AGARRLRARAQAGSSRHRRGPPAGTAAGPGRCSGAALNASSRRGRAPRRRPWPSTPWGQPLPQRHRAVRRRLLPGHRLLLPDPPVPGTAVLSRFAALTTQTLRAMMEPTGTIVPGPCDAVVECTGNSLHLPFWGGLLVGYTSVVALIFATARACGPRSPAP